MVELTPNALAVLRHRYLRRDDTGAVLESPEDMFARVARVVAEPERAHGASEAEVDAIAERFCARMAALEFLPNSPTLMNAGRNGGQLAACFVVPVGDSTNEIFEAVRWAAAIQKTGGGTGFAFSRLRPAGDYVASTGGQASGPVSFMKVFDAATDAIKQGGTRRGANMGVLRVDHPDILDFITLKLDPTAMVNFNLSVAVTDAFMTAVDEGGHYDLVNPRTHQVVRSLDARRVFELIANAAWATGDPGLVFLDRINATQPTPHLGDIEATNPCVTGDTRVWTAEQGMVEIRDLVGTTPVVATTRGGQVEFHRVTRVVCTGERPVYKLITREGYVLRLTADHVVSTERGDVPASTLVPGDRIPIPVARVGQVDHDSSNARLGEVIGWLTGDGHFTHHGRGRRTCVLNFYGLDKRDTAPRLLASARELIGSSRLRLNEVASRDLQYVRSSRLRVALGDLGVDARCKDAVPEIVWRGDLALVAGYLRGLFSADGSVQRSMEKGLSVRLAASKLPLLRDVQLLLQRFGIVSTIYHERRPRLARPMPDGSGGLADYQCAAQHELCVSRASLRRFSQSIGFLIAEKSSRLAQGLSEYQRGPYRDRAYATVAELLPDGTEPVFDLTEPTTSHFFANGLLIHNCGEQPLLPFESCTLGSINLARFAAKGEPDWPRLRGAVRDAVRFLDNVIDANCYPLPEIERATKATRKIGLGVMGFADLLIELGVAYDSPRALELAAAVAAFLETESLAMSVDLAITRGSFPEFGRSRLAAEYSTLRNATTTTVAPTGTISIIAGCSSGIEPLFAVAYERRVLDGQVLTELHPAFVARAQRDGFYSDELIAAVVERGGVRGLEAVPAEVQNLFATAHDLSPATHIRMQAAFQNHVHAAVSKTINLPHEATPEDVTDAYRLAHQLGCKGITVYRDRSKQTQVLAFGGDTPEPRPPRNGGRNGFDRCPECNSTVRSVSNCSVCQHCGWSVC